MSVDKIVASVTLEDISKIMQMKPEEAEEDFFARPSFEQILLKLVSPYMMDIGTLFMTFDKADLIENGDQYKLFLHGNNMKMEPVSRVVELGELPAVMPN